MDVPKNEDVKPRTLVLHTQAVTQQAIAIADVVERIHKIKMNRDVLISAALLHDVSKMMESDSSSEAGGKSRFGQLINHGAYGAHKAFQKGLPTEVVHIILTHTHSSGKGPATLEGAIVHYADMADTDALAADAGKKITLQKRW